MSVAKKTHVGTVDCTPTWAEQARMCILIIENGTNEAAKQFARDELVRMGRIIDSMGAAKKENA